MKIRSNPLIRIGFSSIITILVTICLASFGTLCVLTAYSDYSLNQSTAKNAQAYYAADATARDTLASIDAILFQIYKTSDTSKQYYQQVLTFDFRKELPQAVSNITLIQTDSTPLLSYEISVKEALTLYVTLKIQYPQTDSECFTVITRWQTVNIT